jgi:hypothetical protein
MGLMMEGRRRCCARGLTGLTFANLTRATAYFRHPADAVVFAE